MSKEEKVQEIAAAHYDGEIPSTNSKRGLALKKQPTFGFSNSNSTKASRKKSPTY